MTKRKRKIIAVLVFLLVVMPAGLYLTRNQWVAAAMKYIVSERSHRQITLDFQSIDVGVFSRTLTIEKPELRFEHVVFDKAAGTLLKKAIFHRLVLTNVSLGDVLLHRQFIVDNLLLEKPEFIFGITKKHKKVATSSSFDPSGLIEAMQNHQIGRIHFGFLIRQTEIHFGRVQLDGKKSADIYGNAQYDFTIWNMGTVKYAGDTLHPIFFDNLELTVRDFHRFSAPEKLDIALDSAFYSTRNRKLFLRGIHLNLLGDNEKAKPVTSIFLRWAAVSGLHTRKQKKQKKSWFKLGSFRVVGGQAVFREKSSSKKQKDNMRWLRQLFTAYHLLSLDTLDLRHVHIYHIDKKEDTTMELRRVNIQVNGLWADRRVLAEPVRELHFDTLKFSLNHLLWRNIPNRVKVESGLVSYNSSREQLQVNDLNVRTRCPAEQTSPVSVYGAKQLVIRHFSVMRWQRQKRQLLAFALEDPDIRVIRDSSCRSGEIRWPDALATLVPEQIVIHRGKVSFRKTGYFHITASGLDFFADSVQDTRFSGPGAGLHYDSVYFHVQRSSYTDERKNIRSFVRDVTFDKKFFRLKGIRYFRNDSAGYDSLKAGQLLLTRFQPDSLLFRHVLKARGAYLYRADLHSFRQKDEQNKGLDSLGRQTGSPQIPLKTNIGYVQIRKSSFSLVSRTPDKDFSIRSRVNLKLHRFKMGYDTAHVLSAPKSWQARFEDTRMKSNHLTVQWQKTVLNSDSGILFLKNVQLNQLSDSNLQFRISIPTVSLQGVRYHRLFYSDSIVFGKAVFDSPKGMIHFMRMMSDRDGSNLRRWKLVFDSLRFVNGMLEIRNGVKQFSSLQLNGINLLYHPNRLLALVPDSNLIKQWDFSINRLVFVGKYQKFRMVADRIALQSATSRFHVLKIIGTNFSPDMVDPSNRQMFSYFFVNNMSFEHIFLRGGTTRFLHIKNWNVPSVWVNIINNNTESKKRSLAFLTSGFFNRYTRFVEGVHIDSTFLGNVNLSYQYDRMNKLVNIMKLTIHTQGIQLGKPFLPDSSDALFQNMFINLKDRPVISGDSMYTFRMRDIRINLPERRIRFDSITLTPRFDRKAFFARAGYQTDRITLYGKSAVMERFSPGDLLNGHFIHFGKLDLNNLSVRFERDMHYPRRNVVKPMPIDVLNAIPYKFRIDTVQLNNSMLSYFEYEVKSKNPGIFFIDHFNVTSINVTNHFMPGDSNLVWKFQGSGKLMKQANMDFTLVMPYFAPNQQWWFSAETGKIDLTQFNPLTENVLGITVKSGVGSLQVPMITGDNFSARGSVDFLYKKMKLRLYSRKKSQQSRSVWSPFANLMINGIVVKNNNPPFLGHVKKGIVYFERVPQKSFINYLWKSNLSGILSTIGFNNKQQREMKREEKKQTKAAGKTGAAEQKNPSPKKKENN